MAKHAAEAEERRKKPRKSSSTKRSKPDGECVIPPPPVKHILSSYTLSNPVSKRSISDYVEWQARGETVQHAERIMSERILGRDYNCWDVHTDKDRYWVITTPTNLYSQSLFPSLDYTLSFHIGVMMRVEERQRGAPNLAHKWRFTPIWRRWEQAADAFDDAEEAEDFQAVGMKCRETLIQFVKSLAKPEMVPSGVEAPKRADVVGWSNLIANAIAGGERNSYVRSYLKTIAKSAWELANWLTHASGAARADVQIVLDATQIVIGSFGMSVIRYESAPPERCPECGSYAFDVGFNPELTPPYIVECEHCGWQKQESEHPSNARIT